LKIPRVAAACGELIAVTHVACLALAATSLTGLHQQTVDRGISAMSVLIVTKENGDAGQHTTKYEDLCQ
jgi:hypothetical protein